MYFNCLIPEIMFQTFKLNKLCSAEVKILALKFILIKMAEKQYLKIPGTQYRPTASRASNACEGKVNDAYYITMKAVNSYTLYSRT